MKRSIRMILTAFIVFPAVSDLAQTPETHWYACDTSNRRPQSRFYQRGYAPDDQTDDDLWRYSDLEAQGIDPTIVDGGLALLAESSTRQSLLLMRNGYVVYEAYFNGSRATDSNNIASVSKSMLSALIGIAIEQGHFQSTDDRIAEYLPEYFEAVADTKLRELTLHQMLTMTHGLAWEENRTERLLNRSEDWVADILSLPVRNEPGTVFHYSTGASQVLSAVLTEATGMSVCEFAHRFLFAPLGVEAEFWGVGPQGYFSGGHSVSMTAREVARFGQLFLDEGRWQGEQIVPSGGWLLRRRRKSISATIMRDTAITGG